MPLAGNPGNGIGVFIVDNDRFDTLARAVALRFDRRMLIRSVAGWAGTSMATMRLSGRAGAAPRELSEAAAIAPHGLVCTPPSPPICQLPTG